MVGTIVAMVIALLVAAVLAIRLINREIDRRNGTEDFWSEIGDIVDAARVEEQEPDKTEVGSFR
jgi:hypothetical protein